MGFWVGAWLHDAPEKEFAGNQKRAIVKHLCFGPAETQIWYEFKDGRYCCELQIAEGLQAGELFVDFIAKSDLLQVLQNEIALCQTYGKPELTALFQAEKERLESSKIGGQTNAGL